jgi:hypothetical protein
VWSLRSQDLSDSRCLASRAEVIPSKTLRSMMTIRNYGDENLLSSGVFGRAEVRWTLDVSRFKVPIRDPYLC